MTETVVEDREIKEPRILARIGRILFRTLVAVVVGLAVGAGLYFGAIRVYREAIEPIQGYEARISDLEQQVAFMREASSTESEDINSRQAAVEGRLAEQAEDLASVEALIQATQQDLREQRRILDAVDELASGLEDATFALGDLSLLVENLENQILAGDLPAQRVQRTAVYLRAMSMLTRAQLELYQSNLGFAAEQIESAREILNELVTDTSQETEPDELYGDEELLGTILDRLDIVLADLPDRPEVAGDELEAVWRLLSEAMQARELTESENGGP